ncbi:MAG: hypothetical protein JXR94_01070 [Candidatus Hydrogenedentes bacterium]|nr:hypothetical protein [Candidatus Hydrogenedentota bacterium]
MKKAVLIGLCVGLTACGGNVVETVKYDFGIGEKPEGYEAPSEKVMAQLHSVAKAEMKRMNTEGRQGEVKYQELGEVQGKYYKESKIYEQYHPLDVQPISRGAQGERGYVGFIAYTYRIYQSERQSNRTEAAAASATISTTVTGRETYRYKFNSAGKWDGGEGEEVRR